MLRIHFTADDLARTSVATAADPLWETLFSVFRLRDRERPLEFRSWSQQVRTRLARAAPARPAARLLSALTPLGPYLPDFLTPAAARHGLDAGLEAIRSTPKRRLHHELGRLAACSPLPDWVRPLAEGDVAFLTRLTGELREHHETAVAPYHDQVRGCLDTDRARRTRDLLENGLAGLFDGLRPCLRWSPPVLEVDYAVDKDLHLAGRGLRLVPAFFSMRTPDSLADPDLPPVLVYPIEQASRWTQSSAAGGHRSLEALMGSTRTAVLRAVEASATTSQLARRLRASLPSISRHTGVLRDAGLITTHRHGNAVLHALTPLGSALLQRHQPLL